MYLWLWMYDFYRIVFCCYFVLCIGTMVIGEVDEDVIVGVIVELDV